MAKQRRIYSPDQQRERKKEWLSLADGDVCLWSMRMREFARISELSTRPPEDPRGGVDAKEAMLWQVALSCYDGDGPDAKRIWDDHQVHMIWDMPTDDFNRLLLAINRLNGKDATAEEIARDFTGAAPVRSTTGSRSGASGTSTAYPKN